MEDAGCDLELALSWAMAAKNSLKKWMTLFQTNLFSGEASLNSKLPVLEGNHLKQVVASNVNAMDTAREASFKVNPVTGFDMLYNIKSEHLGMFITLLEVLLFIKEKIIVSGQEEPLGRTVNKKS